MRSPTLLLSSAFATLGVGIVVFQAAPALATLVTTYSCPTNLSATATTVYGTKCYAYYANALSWSNAKTACNNVGGQLAVIDSSGKDSAIASIATTDVWFGAADNGSLITGSSEGTYYWITGTAFWDGAAIGGAYTNWETGEPNDFGFNEDCALKYTADGKWNDYVCGNGRHYVCEINAIDTISDIDTAEPENQGAGGLRSTSLQRRIDSTRGSKHFAAPAASSVSSAATSVSPAVMGNAAQKECQRYGYASLSPAKKKAINTKILKKFGQGCQS